MKRLLEHHLLHKRDSNNNDSPLMRCNNNLSIVAVAASVSAIAAAASYILFNNKNKKLLRKNSIKPMLAENMLRPAIQPMTTEQFQFADMIEKLSYMIPEEMEKHRVPGMSIALVDDQKVVWSRGFGYADYAKKIESTGDTLYEIGSITKLFTAMAIMQLHERGQLSIDDRLDKFIPELKSLKKSSRFTTSDNNDAITLRMLLCHHSGVVSNIFKGMWSFNPSNTTTVSHERFLEVLLKDGASSSSFVAFPPNFTYNYSNVGYTLLGLVVERVSGTPFAEYLKTNIFFPLGMVNTSFSDIAARRTMESNDNDNDNIAKPHHMLKEMPRMYVRDAAAGGMISSVNELALFMSKAIFSVFSDSSSNDNSNSSETHLTTTSTTSTIIRRDTLEEMLRPQPNPQQNDELAAGEDVTNTTTTTTGLGLIKWGLGFGLSGQDITSSSVVDPPPRLAAFHSGGTFYMHSQFAVLPESKLGVVVLSNSSVGRGLVDSVATEALKQALEAKGLARIVADNNNNDDDDANGSMRPTTPPEEPAELTEDEVRSFEGYYSSPLGLLAVSRASNNRSLYAYNAGKWFRLDAVTLPSSNAHNNNNNNAGGGGDDKKKKKKKRFVMKNLLFGFIPWRWPSSSSSSSGLSGSRIYFDSTATGQRVVVLERGAGFQNRLLLASQTSEDCFFPDGKIPKIWRDRLNTPRYILNHDEKEEGVRCMISSIEIRSATTGKGKLLLLSVSTDLPHASGFADKVLRVVSDTEAVIDGVAMGLGETISIIRGGGGGGDASNNNDDDDEIFVYSGFKFA